jgi:hypothetical protein
MPLMAGLEEAATAATGGAIAVRGQADLPGSGRAPTARCYGFCSRRDEFW